VWVDGERAGCFRKERGGRLAMGWLEWDGVEKRRGSLFIESQE
jgi:hypothetical protein